MSIKRLREKSRSVHKSDFFTHKQVILFRIRKQCNHHDWTLVCYSESAGKSIQIVAKIQWRITRSKRVLILVLHNRCHWNVINICKLLKTWSGLPWLSWNISMPNYNEFCSYRDYFSAVSVWKPWNKGIFPNKISLNLIPMQIKGHQQLHICQATGNQATPLARLIIHILYYLRYKIQLTGWFSMILFKASSSLLFSHLCSMLQISVLLWRFTHAQSVSFSHERPRIHEHWNWKIKTIN